MVDFSKYLRKNPSDPTDDLVYGPPVDPTDYTTFVNATCGALGYIDDLIADLGMSPEDALALASDPPRARLADLSVAEATELIERLQRERGFQRYRKDRAHRLENEEIAGQEIQSSFIDELEPIPPIESPVQKSFVPPQKPDPFTDAEDNQHSYGGRVGDTIWRRKQEPAAIPGPSSPEGIVESLNEIDSILAEKPAVVVPEHAHEIDLFVAPTWLQDRRDDEEEEDDSLYGSGDTLSEDRDFERSFTCGVAGSGKTWSWRERMKNAPNPNSYLLCATTGIAAVNLGADFTTIHSTLGFFDYDSLEDRFMGGGLTRRFAELAKDGIRHVVVDESSMLSAAHLDILHKAAREAAGQVGNTRPCGLHLIGDFLQLGPIADKNKITGAKIPGTDKFAFESQHWGEYGKNTNHLTKIWRQGNLEFINALNAARAGRGEEAVALLQACNVEFTNQLDSNFEGTTLCATNDEVDRFNTVRLAKLESPPLRPLANRKFGTPDVERKNPGEWRQVPAALEVKVGAYVMLLENCKAAPGGEAPGRGFYYVNGDTGTIVDWDPTRAQFTVELVRGKQVVVTRSLRLLLWKHPPREFEEQPKKSWPKVKRAEDIVEDEFVPMWKEEGFKAVYVEDKERWLHGAMFWWPMRLAWASSVHKSQGLTLERLQINPTHHFFSNPGSAYVALSRCRGAEGLRVVGQPGLLAKRVRVDPRVADWV